MKDRKLCTTANSKTATSKILIWMQGFKNRTGCAQKLKNIFRPKLYLIITSDIKNWPKNVEMSCAGRKLTNFLSLNQESDKHLHVVNETALQIQSQISAVFCNFLLKKKCATQRSEWPLYVSNHKTHNNMPHLGVSHFCKMLTLHYFTTFHVNKICRTEHPHNVYFEYIKILL
jgi:hypothetical protein